MDGGKARQPVTRSTSDSPISLMASTPPVTADVACCATSLATRVTRAIGAGTRDFFALFFAGLLAAAALVFPRDAVALRRELDRFEAATLARPFFAVARLEVFRLPAREPVFARDFLAFEAIGISPWGSIVNRGRGRHSKN